MWKMFKEKTVVLVTGASRGIGRATAAAFAREGCYVLINYKSSEKAAEELKQEIQENGGEAALLKADVADRDAVESMFRVIKSKIGHLDIVVNNAGITRDGYLLMMGENNFDAVLRTNLYGCYYVTQQALRYMCRQHSGVLVNVASTAGISGQAGQANYSASKGAVIAFTRAVAKEYASYGIRCNAVAPGFIETDMTADRDGRSLKKEWRELIPLHTFGCPEDVADAILYLSSEHAAYITGKVLTVDGGLIA